MTAPVYDTPAAWQNFIDVANDVKPWLQIPSGVTADDPKLQDIVDMACWWVQDYIGRPVAPTQFFRRFNGYTGFGGSTIDLPYFPILGTPTVVEWWGSSGPHTLTLQTPESQGGSDMFTLDSQKGFIIRSYLGLLQRPTFPGLKNIEVTWTAGYNPVPPPIKMATRELVQYWWRNTQEAVRVQRPMTEYDATGPSDLWPAVPNRITALLETFRQVNIA